MKKAYTECIISMLIFGTIGIMRRLIPLSSSLLAFTRGILGGVYLVIFMTLTKRKGAKTERRDLLLLLLTGALIGLNWVFLFESYNFTTVSTATMCYYMQPVFVIVLSPVFLKERLTLKKGLCALVSVAGMLFVSGVFGGAAITERDTLGIVYGLAAAFLYASVIILNKKTGKVDAYRKTAVELFSASLTILPYLLLTEDFTSIPLSFSSVFLVLLVGVFHTGIAYTMYFSSMKSLPAGSVAMLSYIDPVSALILSSLVLGERMLWTGWLGAGMILVSAIVSECGRKKQ